MIIFHTGDIHLDSPFSGLDLATAEDRRRDLRDTFERMMNYAKNIKSDLVLIAGDVFDEGFATRETIAFMIKCFNSLDCPVVISPGNHDPYNPQSIWNKKLLPDNVYVFSSPVLSSFDFDDLNCKVYGWAFTSRSLKECPIGNKTVEDPSKYNILLAHADVTSPFSAYCPVSKETLSNFGADYCALGHIHSPEKVNEFLGNTAAYCGCPEGRDFGECGIKGARVIRITKEDNVSKLESSFVRFCQKTYSEIQVDCDNCIDTVEITNRIMTIAEPEISKDTLLRVNLNGSVDPSLVIDTNSIAKKITGFAYVEVIDNTAPTVGADFYQNDKGIRGEIYRILLPQLESSDVEERDRARKAFKYAIAALNGENLVDN